MKTITKPDPEILRRYERRYSCGRTAWEFALSETRRLAKASEQRSNRELLLQRLTALRDEHPENFDLRLFTSDAPNSQFVHSLKQYTCGYTACVGGWLPVWFPDDWMFHNNCPTLIIPETYMGEFIHDCADFFGGEPTEWYDITMPNSYPEERCDRSDTPTLPNVISRIEQLHTKLCNQQ